MIAMMQAMIDKAVSRRFESVNFESFLRQTIDDLDSSPRYLVKVSEALFKNDNFLERLAGVVISETERIIKADSKCVEQIKRFTRAARKTVSVRWSPFSESPPTEISDERTIENVYFMKYSDKEERQRGKTEDPDSHTKKKQKSKSRNPLINRTGEWHI